MDAYKLPIALVVVFSFAAYIPVMSWFLGAYAPSLTPADQFIAYLVPVALVGLFIAGWIQPGGV